ncbi:MAG: hypothetical protein IPN10_12275, partial [Saprospiraceae bacterium]|nr:hypothetical protein [Saprospiraceae bacterium]
MRSLYTKFLTLIFVFLTTYIHSQISITVTGNLNTTPTLSATYLNLNAALNDLNAVTVMTGPVILTCDAGTSETAPTPTGFTIGSASLNSVLSATNTITINTTGGVVTINAGVGTATPGSAAPDGILKLLGADYVEINGLTFTDGNVTNPATMEYGLGLFKRAAGDGCNNNLIRNCTFNMQRINNAAGSGPMFDGSVGILVINSTPTAATTSLTPTNGGTLATNGTNSENRFQLNTINGGNIGIGLSGFLATTGVGPTPNAATFLGDLNNQVGTTGRGNTILNFGGGAATSAAAGIRANHQWSISILDNTINNNDGGGVNHASTLRGIFLQGTTSGNITCSNNNLTIKGGATTSQVTMIENAAGSTPLSNTITLNNNTLTGDYLTATTGVFYGIWNNTALPTTLNIQNNTISNLVYSTNSLTGTGALNPIFTSGNNASSTFNVTNNTVSNISRFGTTGGTTNGINVSSGITGMVVNVNTNTVSNMSIDGTGIGSTMYGIVVPTGTLVVNGNQINSLTCIKTTGTGEMNGLRSFASPVNENYNNNTVHTITHNGTGTVIGINTNTAAGTRTLSGNVVHTISGAGLTITGIAQTSSVPNVFNNKVYNIFSTSTGAPTVSGIAITSTTAGTANIYNNIIGDLRAPNASSTGPTAPTIRGINISSTTALTNINVHFNTIYLDASTTGTNFATAAIFHTVNATSTTAQLTLRSNIFINVSTPAGSGFTVAYQRSGTALNNYEAFSNNNLFFANTPGASNLIFYDGTNSDQTMAAFKVRVTPRETNSARELTPFLSLVGSNAGFLHIDPTIPTQAESGGVSVVGVTLDFDGDTRNGSTPDIGADEFVGVPLDFSPPSISYTNLTNTTSTLNRTTTSFAAITDASGVNTTAGTNPRIYYKKSTDPDVFNDNTAGTTGWKFAQTSSGSTPFDFTIDYTLLNSAPVVVGDVIQYFVAAQDLGVPTVGINAGTFALTPASVALTNAAFPIGGSIKSYTIVPSISGILTVPGTHASLTLAGGAFEAINNALVTGNITIEIDGDLTGENGTIGLNQFNSPFTVTIKPKTSARSITGSSSGGSIIRLNGADRVTIDGSTSGGTDKSLTIENTASTSNSTVIWVSSLGTGAGATNNTIKNCNIKGGNIVTNTASFGIFAGGTTISDGGTGDDNDDLTIQNNTITKASIGVYARAASTGVLNNLNIVGNTIGSATATDYITRKGITIAQATDGTINSNTVFNLITASVSGTLTAIESGAGVTNYTIHKNNIDEISNTGTSVFRGGQGITLNTGAVGANVSVFNNMIGNLKGDGSGTLTNNSWGVMVLSGGGYAIDYNTINIDDNRLTTGSADLSGGIHLAATATSVSLRNNLISVTGLPGNPTTGRMFGIHSLAAAPFTVSNYNDLYVTGAQHSVGFLTSNRNTLADWQTASSQDANSIFVLPLYQSATDLHLNMGLTNTQLEQGGIVVAGITTDFDGNARPGPAGSVNGGGTIPDIGADEFDGVPAVPMTYVSSTVTQVTGGSATPSTNQQVIRIEVVTAGVVSPISLTSLTLNANGTTNIADINAATAKIYYTGATPTFTPVGLFGSLTPTIANFNITGSQALLSGSNYFWLAYDVTAGATNGNLLDGECVSITVGSPQTPTVTMPSGSRTIVGPMAGNYNVGTGQVFPNFVTITEAVSNLNSRGVSAAVTVTLLDATYNVGTGESFPLTINEITGASATNTISIKPATGVTSAISGSSTSSIFILNGADYVTINGTNSATVNSCCPLPVSATRDLTITNTNTGTSSAVVWVQTTAGANAATNNQVINCNLVGSGVTQTLFGVGSGSATISTSSLGTSNNNNSFINNNISGVQYGIYSQGASLANKNTGTIINQNIISTSANTKGGIWVGFEDAPTISCNSVSNIAQTSSPDVFGITLGMGTSVSATTSAGNEVTNATVTNNTIGSV